MSGRIPQNFIDDLISRTDIVDLIDGFVPLRKAGSNYQALCPFHDEKSPSFTVTQDKQFYHCFGCGANGTAISFLMEYNRMEFVEAVEELAARAGLEIPRQAGHASKDNSLSELYELLELVTQFYCRQLREHPQAQRAVEYLKHRNLSAELAGRFELGYATPGWDNLISALGKSDAAQQRLARAGMIIQRDKGGYYDRFRDRIMFPIRDQRGRVIGFGGRVIDDGEPKYLNSPETPIYHKGNELYGLYQARHANKEINQLYVVEGYMDVLALVQHDVTNVVATLGTAATSDQLERLFRSTAQIVFCFDGDTAGRKAAWRALETSLPLLRDGRQVYYRFIPQGEDPDSFIRQHGKQQFEDDSHFLCLSDYLLQELTKDFNPTIMEHKGKLLHDISPYLKKLPTGNLKQLLVREVAKLADTEPDSLERQLQQSRDQASRRPTTLKAQNKVERSLLAQTIRLLLRRPKLALHIADPKDMTELDLPGTDFLAEVIKLIHQNTDISCAGIIENWRGSKYEQRLSELATTSASPYEKDEEVYNTDEYLESEFAGAVNQLQELSRKRKLTNFGKPKNLSDEQKSLLRNLNPAARSVSKD